MGNYLYQCTKYFLNQSSAKTFHTVLKKIFFSGNKAATMVLTNNPLSKIFVDPAIKYFKRIILIIYFQKKLIELAIKNNIVEKYNN